MKLSNMATVMRAAGLTVVETPGWASRGYTPPGGKPLDLAACRGVMWHHTATASVRNMTSGAPTLNLCIVGRSDLPGPLCHIVLGRDGTCYLVAAGLANHAGWGKAPGIPDDTGNYYFIGIEMESSGVAPWDWTLDQLRVAPHLGAALERAYLGWLEPDMRLQMAHYEYSTAGKIDPAGWPGGMDGLRASINKVLAGVDPAGEVTEEDEMAVSPKEVAAAVWVYSGKLPEEKNEQTMWRRLVNANLGIARVEALVKAQGVAIEALANSKGLDGAALVADIGAKVEEAMAKVVQVQVSVEGGDS